MEKSKYDKYFVQPVATTSSAESEASYSAANGRFIAAIEASYEAPGAKAGRLDDCFGDVGAVQPHNATAVVRGGHGAGH